VNTDDIEFKEPINQISPSGTPEPIEPGKSRTVYEGDIVGRNIEPNRGGTIFIMGILSLAFCWPLGLVAWLMGRTDLANMRTGTTSSERKSLVQIGMFLGLVGMLIPIITIILLIIYAPKILDQFPPLEEMFKKHPLKAKHLSYVGLWRGNKGSKIVIRRDGTADFKSKSTSVTGGRVKIKGEALSIGIMGFGKEWHIDQPPKYTDDQWIMKLDGETFTRKAQESIVRKVSIPILIVSMRFTSFQTDS
jgi:heme/copper-type cytochrome/quinol oxidase subunit 2